MAMEADNRSSKLVLSNNLMKYARDIVFLDCSNLMVEKRHSGLQCEPLQFIISSNQIEMHVSIRILEDDFNYLLDKLLHLG